MRDPFAVLKDALQPIFHLTRMRNGSYIYPEVQQLKQSLDNFQTNDKRKLIALLKTIRAALPYIEKCHVNFYAVKTQVDVMAKALNLPLIQWDNYLSHSNASPKFKFSALSHKPHDSDLLPWLAQKSGAAIKRNNPDSLMNMLLEYKEHFGFSQKLSAHLKKEPDFLVRLIMESEHNFVQIVRTRLVLYLTDRQLAEAIIKHIPHFVQNNQNPITKAAQLVDKLNEILSNGRSISTLLRNAEAKFILDSSEFIQAYQKDEVDKNVHTSPRNSPTSLEEGEFKLRF